ncbi:MAG: YdeI/OmpD-associated family protein [Alphaproteobacteria bacterium]|nr:YdeI/OmpD-associated family protein [Alphaproteobacteria bacterium]
MAKTVAGDIQSALAGDKAAGKIFSALPPSHRNEYLRWIGEARKPDTRSRRIAQMLERLKA